jgi:hypothetical protein
MNSVSLIVNHGNSEGAGFDVLNAPGLHSTVCVCTHAQGGLTQPDGLRQRHGSFFVVFSAEMQEA